MKKIRKEIFIGISVFIVFFLYTNYLENRYDNSFKNEEIKTLQVKIVSIKESGDYYDKYTAKIKSGENKNLKILLYIKKSDFEYGDILKISGEIEKPDGAYNDGGFNYSEYLKQKKIYRICTTEKFEKIGKEKDFACFLYKVKTAGISKIEKMYSEEEARIFKSNFIW